MALLLDNDIVYKLAQLDLLQSGATALENECGELQILDTLKYKLCPPRAARRATAIAKYGADVVNRIDIFVNSGVSQLDSPIEHTALLNALTTHPENLDEGEMRLLQALLETDNKLLLTGDKRFLKALITAGLAETLEPINGQLVCFEQIICFLIRTFGFGLIKTRFIEALAANLVVDGTLANCFIHPAALTMVGFSQHSLMEKAAILSPQATQAQVGENIAYWINKLRQDSGQLLSVNDKWSPPSK